MTAPEKEDDLITGINVTPLVDITLVLLIIFMVTAVYIVAPAIKVKLPKAATAESTPITSVALVLDINRVLYFNGTPTNEEDVRKILGDLVREKTDVQAMISADKDVTHGEVIHLMDLVRQLGITKFAVNVEGPRVAPAPH
ncbi:MAG: biopolymer transporter ExbD [Nitrospirae bacterium]|nr:biopolymer transporter ExbD [Nitrospirota bacterium]